MIFNEKLARGIAIAGGLFLLATAIMVSTSVVLITFFKSNVKGDFEMAQMANAIAIFAFMPLCNLNKGHVMVDTFTNWLSPRINEIIDGVWNLLITLIMLMLAFHTFRGAIDSYKSNMKTMVLALPQSPAIMLCAILAGIAALYSLHVGFKQIRGQSA